jgi:hypothetical protein
LSGSETIIKECDTSLHLGATLMPSDLVDLTLPAHDPNFPKPRGLLPVPHQVAEQVADFEARFVREHGVSIAPEARQRMLDDWTLRYYYDGTYVAYRRTNQGVDVLAVGWDEARKYLDPRSSEIYPDVRVGTV